jgi:hypothetical protein
MKAGLKWIFFLFFTKQNFRPFLKLPFFRILLRLHNKQLVPPVSYRSLGQKKAFEFQGFYFVNNMQIAITVRLTNVLNILRRNNWKIYAILQEQRNSF